MSEVGRSEKLTVEGALLVQVDVMLFIRSARTLRRATTTPATLLTDALATSVRKTPFLFHSDLQIPQSHLRAIPATCLLKDDVQEIFHRWFRYLNGCCDFCVRASSGKKRGDRPFFACKIRVSREHLCTPEPNVPSKSVAVVPGVGIRGVGGLQSHSGVRIARSDILCLLALLPGVVARQCLVDNLPGHATLKTRK